MAQEVIDFCKCPVCAWKECGSVFVGCSFYICSPWLTMLNCTSLIFFPFSLLVVLVTKRNVLIVSNTLILHLFHLSSSDFCFMYFEVVLLGTYVFRIVYLCHQFNLLKSYFLRQKYF